MDRGNNCNHDHLVITILRLVEDQGGRHEVNFRLVHRRPRASLYWRGDFSRISALAHSDGQHFAASAYRSSLSEKGNNR